MIYLLYCLQGHNIFVLGLPQEVIDTVASLLIFHKFRLLPKFVSQLHDLLYISVQPWWKDLVFHPLLSEGDMLIDNIET